MGSGTDATGSSVVAAFHHTLWRQFLVVVLLVVAVGVLRAVLRARQLRALSAGDGRPALGPPPPTGTGAPAVRLLRVGFGLFWILDGILQGQSAMPLGLPLRVMQPATTGTPGWVQHLVHFAVTTWLGHPVTAAAAVVWIQVGIGLALLAAPPGGWSRAAGAASVGWGLVVWVFGEAFGGVMAPGASWLFGAPGAALLCAVAGVLIALPARTWEGPTAGRWLLRGAGALFLGLAVLQAWPGRGFWQGGRRGGVVVMVRSMAQTHQPAPLADLVRAFGTLAAGHGWGVNLGAVTAMAAVGVGLVAGAGRVHEPRPAIATAAAVAATVLCLADWVLVQDLGFFGGVGTDPNSMPVLALLVATGWTALRHPATATARAATVPAAGTPTSRRSPASVLNAPPAYLLRAAAALAAFAVVLLGAVPMAVATASPSVSPALTEAVNGPPAAEDVPAPDFHLLDQAGRPVSLATFRGRVVALAFLDPVCTNDCPIIAQELRMADAALGATARRVAVVAVATNPIYHSPAVVRAFDRQEGLTGLANWYFLSGPLPRLRQAWRAYGVTAADEPAGAMVAHSELAAVIDPRGRLRVILGTNPGAAAGADRASFSSLLDQELHRFVGRP